MTFRTTQRRAVTNLLKKGNPTEESDRTQNVSELRYVLNLIKEKTYIIEGTQFPNDGAIRRG